MHHLLELINQDMKRRKSKDKDSSTGAKEIQQVNRAKFPIRGGSSLSEKGVHIYEGVGVAFADFI